MAVLGAAMAVLGAAMAVLGAAMAVLGAAMAVLGAAIAVLGAAIAVLGAAIAVLGAAMAVLGAAMAVLGAPCACGQHFTCKFKPQPTGESSRFTMRLPFITIRLKRSPTSRCLSIMMSLFQLVRSKYAGHTSPLMSGRGIDLVFESNEFPIFTSRHWSLQQVTAKVMAQPSGESSRFTMRLPFIIIRLKRSPVSRKFSSMDILFQFVRSKDAGHVKPSGKEIVLVFEPKELPITTFMQSWAIMHALAGLGRSIMPHCEIPLVQQPVPALPQPAPPHCEHPLGQHTPSFIGPLHHPL